ncbi:MBL fold metallo-hydrolase [Spelaeicoccus albus]|uniref:L-ascorbate metabolism protein UlaG (Beta-lactamase superfamily) n=1 Tax=Spelaeicoccus albus TaxID=1280376 RepID=A0A7Z0A9L5_9MICO|nr:MBL fold metallo-hydrolase [Spelaeicoccus albus]NYI66136.1 L-ascorbate metabolism protein UlaG (beta-lactamase superfamily) [Spelaeicoccus albus]
MQLTRFGHAAVLVDAADSRILLDPGNFSADDTFELTGLEAIIVTHQHADHVDHERLPQLVAGNPGARLLAEEETAAQLNDVAGTWEVLSPGDEVFLGGVLVTGVGGRHAVIHQDLPRVGNVGALVRADGEPVFFHPGDTYEYAPDDVDVLGVPLGAPWAKVGEMVDFVRDVSPSVVFPIHDRTIADVAYGMYWARAAEMGGANLPTGVTLDARKLGQHDSTTVR